MRVARRVVWELVLGLIGRVSMRWALGRVLLFVLAVLC